jgi:hypothetical protein
MTDELRPKDQVEVAAKAPTKEDEFFKKEEAAAKERHAVAKAERERAELREKHYMRCPKCGGQLVEEPHEICDIDRCTDCHGIWLDPGELDKFKTKEKGFFSKLFG